MSEASDAAGETARAKRQAATASSLDAVATELAAARKRLRPVPADFGDLSDLPEELVSQLNLVRVDELEQQIRDIVAAADGREVSVDSVMIELYRRHKRIEQRRFIMNKLYRMAQKNLIHSVDGRKGVYFIPKASSGWGSTNSRGFADDLDDDIPF
jgi:hypothetical protein